MNIAVSIPPLGHHALEGSKEPNLLSPLSDTVSDVSPQLGHRRIYANIEFAWTVGRPDTDYPEVCLKLEHRSAHNLQRSGTPVSRIYEKTSYLRDRLEEHA